MRKDRNWFSVTCQIYFGFILKKGIYPCLLGSKARRSLGRLRVPGLRITGSFQTSLVCPLVPQWLHFLYLMVYPALRIVDVVTIREPQQLSQLVCPLTALIRLGSGTFVAYVSVFMIFSPSRRAVFRPARLAFVIFSYPSGFEFDLVTIHLSSSCHTHRCALVRVSVSFASFGLILLVLFSVVILVHLSHHRRSPYDLLRRV